MILTSTSCFNTLKHDEEKRRDIAETVRDTKFGCGGQKLYLRFEGSQVVPAHPSGRGNAYDRNYFI
jgi:hypothetical protein